MTLPQGSETPAAAGQPDSRVLPEQLPAQDAAAGQLAPAPPPQSAQPQSAQPQSAQPQSAQPAVEPGNPAAPPAQHVVKRTRVGGIWIASGLFALVLLLLLIFILENSQKVKISYFGATGHLPLGVALLLAAVLGILLVVLPGSARIIQLRRTARRHRKLDAKAAQAGTAAPAAGAGSQGTGPA